MIPTSRYLFYARGYIDLGMVNEASDELEAIDWEDRMTPKVLAVREDLCHAAKNWELMADIAKHLAETLPDQSDGWVIWTYALRIHEQVQGAKEVALRGLEPHPDCTILRFNLACYLSLLGETTEAKAQVRSEIDLDQRFQQVATEDLDLTAMWDAFGE